MNTTTCYIYVPGELTIAAAPEPGVTAVLSSLEEVTWFVEHGHARYAGYQRTGRDVYEFTSGDRADFRKLLHQYYDSHYAGGPSTDASGAEASPSPAPELGTVCEDGPYPLRR